MKKISRFLKGIVALYQETFGRSGGGGDEIVADVDEAADDVTTEDEAERSKFIGDWNMGWFCWRDPENEPATTAPFYVRWRKWHGLCGWRVRSSGFSRLIGDLHAGGRVWAGNYYLWDEGPFDPENRPFATFVFVLSENEDEIMGAWHITGGEEGPQPMWATRNLDSPAVQGQPPGWPEGEYYGFREPAPAGAA